MANDREFSEKTVLITGASQGIGYATARQFAEAGAALVLLDVQDGVTEKASKLAAEYETKALGLVADLRSAEQVRRAVDAAVTEFGGIDVAANVAGIFPMMVFEAQSDEDLAEVMNVNFLGAMRVCQAAIPAMRKRKGCSIVNVISGAAFIPMFGYTAYCASKGALLAASRSLAVELAPDIRVNMVSPGVTTSESIVAAMGGQPDSGLAQTFLDRIPMSAFAAPEDIAHAIVFLASPQKAGHITGATIQVNGGALMS